MKRRWLIVLVVALLALPSAVMAQDATPIAPPAVSTLDPFMPTPDELGGRWSLRGSVSGIHPTIQINRRSDVFGGRDGSRLAIFVFDLPENVSDRSEDWEMLHDVWQNWANAYEYPGPTSDDRPNGAPSNLQDASIPGINDGLRYAHTTSFGMCRLG